MANSFCLLMGYYAAILKLFKILKSARYLVPMALDNRLCAKISFKELSSTVPLYRSESSSHLCIFPTMNKQESYRNKTYRKRKRQRVVFSVHSVDAQAITLNNTDAGNGFTWKHRQFQDTYFKLHLYGIPAIQKRNNMILSRQPMAWYHVMGCLS